MGLFNLFKSKKNSKQELQKSETPEDFNPLDINSVIGYIKKQKPGTNDKEAMEIFQKIYAPSKDQKHLTSDRKLPTGWYYHNKDFINKVQDEYNSFLNNWIDNRYKSPKERYASLKSLILYIQDLRKLCKRKGECYEYWLSEKFCSFSDADYNRWLQELKYIEEHYDELNDEYKKKVNIEEVIIPKLKKELPKLIKKSPGILQTEVYKMYPADYKEHVSYALYKMAHEGLITREKTGRTYSLRIKK